MIIFLKDYMSPQISGLLKIPFIKSGGDHTRVISIT
jgi:hypothetical protein